jgi:hypothetical protein
MGKCNLLRTRITHVGLLHTFNAAGTLEGAGTRRVR